MTPREVEEYRALRATIRERGTTRVWVFVAGMTAWAAAVVATTALASTPIALLLPLLVLVAAFEGVFGLHVGVERIGRYLQVFFEADESAARWEHAAMAWGRPAGAVTTDPLFAVPFFLAALFNFVSALVTEPVPVELIFLGGAHALFVLRLVVARAAAAKQRAIDLKRFQELKANNLRA